MGALPVRRLLVAQLGWVLGLLRLGQPMARGWARRRVRLHRLAFSLRKLLAVQ